MAAGHSSSLVSSSSLVRVLLGALMVAKWSSRTPSDPGQDAQTAVHKLTLGSAQSFPSLSERSIPSPSCSCTFTMGSS